MRLEEYLEALSNCPDEQLRDELGIYDNWPIFMQANFDRVIECLKSQEYLLKDTIERPRGIIHLFDYIPGTVELQVFNWIPLAFTTGSGVNRTESDKLESERQLRDYNITIMLHPDQERRIEGVNILRAIAIVVYDIGQFAIREKIPASMPNSIGLRYKDQEDSSKIVYHAPSLHQTAVITPELPQ